MNLTKQNYSFLYFFTISLDSFQTRTKFYASAFLLMLYDISLFSLGIRNRAESQDTILFDN